MPYPRQIAWAKFRVTMVCVVASLILITLFWLLTGGTLFQKKATLYLYIPDATGLERGAPVSVNGIDVGKVSAVGLSGSNQPNRIVRVSLSVSRPMLHLIPTDSTAQISNETMLGDKFVDVTSGRSPTHIKSRGEIQYQPPTTFVKTLDLEQFEQQLRILDATLRDIEEGRTPLGQFVIGDQMYRDVLSRVIDIQNALHRATNTATPLGRMFYTDQFYRTISDPLVSLDQSLAKIQSGQGTAGQLLRDSGEYEHLRSAAGDLRSSIANLRSAPFMQSDTQYTDWNRRLTSLAAAVDQFNSSPLFRTSLVYDNLTGFTRDLAESLRDFHENPRKYLWIKIF